MKKNFYRDTHRILGELLAALNELDEKLDSLVGNDEEDGEDEENE